MNGFVLRWSTKHTRSPRDFPFPLLGPTWPTCTRGKRIPKHVVRELGDSKQSRAGLRRKFMQEPSKISGLPVEVEKLPGGVAQFQSAVLQLVEDCESQLGFGPRATELFRCRLECAPRSATNLGRFISEQRGQRLRRIWGTACALRLSLVCPRRPPQVVIDGARS